MNTDTWLWLFRSLGSFKSRIVALVASATLLGAAGASVPLLLQRLVDDAAAGSLNVMVACIFVGATLVTALPLTFIQRDKLRNTYRYELRGKLLQHLLRMDMSFHEDRGSTIVTTQAAKGVTAAGDMINIIGHGQVLIHFPIAVFAAVYVASYSVVAALLLMGFLALFGVAGKIVGGKLSDAEEQYHDIDTELTHRQREAVQHITTVKVHHAQDTELSHYRTKGQSALMLRNKLTHMYAAFWFLAQGGNSFAYLVSITAFLPGVIDGSLTIGTFFALTMYASRVIQPASFLGDFYAEIKRASAMLAPVINILKVEPQVVEQEHPLTLNPLRHDITVQNVTFRYPGSQKDILRGCTLRVPARKKTAIVGPSGSGKTTLARLLTRLYDPTEGVIEFDGTDVRNLSFSSMYGQVAYLSQEVPIFTGSVEDNVAFGVEGYEEREVLEALDRSSAGFVHSDNDGIGTKIGEMGKKLSGGERQRIALARIFMRDPCVVILDEATSALDNVTEAHVHSTFEDLSKMNGGKTMIVIAHRLSTVRNADQIVVLDKGVVVDVGTHEELLTRCDMYKELNSTFAG